MLMAPCASRAAATPLAQGRNIGQVHAPKMCSLLRQPYAFTSFDVEEHDGRLLTRKVTNDRFPNARCAPRNKNDLADEIWLNAGHGFLPSGSQAASSAANEGSLNHIHSRGEVCRSKL
jgi:hypothetical protein